MFTPTAALLRLAYNALSAEIFAWVAAAGYEDLRPSHGNVLEQLAMAEGKRLTDLASGAGMTLQSMSELVDDLERRGYIERRPDPADRRAKGIFLTDRGRENVAVSWEGVQRSERRVSDALGAADYAALRALLQRVLDAHSASPESGAD